MRIGELRKWGRESLLAAGIPSAQLDSDLLLSHSTGRTREYLMAHEEVDLLETQQLLFRDLLLRRVKREPIAYILERKEFYGLQFYVDSSVLIPRPETEILVEEVLRVFQSTEGEKVIFIDIGTGSGCIPLSVMLSLDAEKVNRASSSTGGGLKVFASDLSEAALKVARRNAKAFGLESKIEFFPGSLFKAFRESELHAGTFAIITANLPYVSTAETLEPDVLQFEPHSALFGGPLGEELVKQCISELDRFRPCSRGCLLLEVGLGQAERIQAYVAQLPAMESVIIRDLQGVSRVLRINYRDVCS